MKATITDFYYEQVSVAYPAEVIFFDNRMKVSFKDDELRIHVTYVGEEVGPDRWLLRCPEVRGKASLSRSPIDPNCLEGRFIQDGGEGMWMIDVDEE